MSFKWIFIIVLILIFFHPAAARADVDPGFCDSCHKIASQPELGDCMVCHDSPHGSEPLIPVSQGPVKVHKKHNRLGYLPQEDCQQCHKPSDVIQCSDCHATHTEEITVNRSCTDCHESLPSPLGHTAEREQLETGNHSWMQDCSVCHSGENLKFGEIMVVPIDDSVPLCSICHSQEYKEMSLNEHGKSSDSCVDCHNPHDTKPPAGKDISLDVPELNASGIIEATKKIPLIGNPLFLLVILIIIISAAYEYAFARPEKGKILMADNIRLNAFKNQSRAMEVWLTGYDVETLNKVTTQIKSQDVRLIGITMKTDPTKIVLFLDFSSTQTTPEELLDNIGHLDENIESANYSEKYEV